MAVKLYKKLATIFHFKTLMARKKSSSHMATNLSPISIGNCEIFIDGGVKDFKCESNSNFLEISTSKGTKIKVSVRGDVNASKNGGVAEVKVVENGKEKERDGSHLHGFFLLINPKDADSSTKSLIQEILSLYKKELPAMKYAANTGKQSSFLEKCVSNGKFCTLLLRLRSAEGSGKVIAAITYQIIPADTQYAEIPLASVCSTYQHKGIGRLLYMELRKRLQDVGISTVLCWGDKETEGFWHKQAFVSVAEVDTKGRAKRLPIRADIRRALCFLGGSTLMVSHLNKNLHCGVGSSVKLCLKSPEKSLSSTNEFYSVYGSAKCDLSNSITALSAGQDNLQLELKDPGSNSTPHCQELVCLEKMDSDKFGYSMPAEVAGKEISAIDEQNTKRVWKASSSSLKSKRVKATHVNADYQSCSASVFGKKQIDSPSKLSHLGTERNMSEVKSKPVNIEERAPADAAGGDLIRGEAGRGEHFNILLMDMANETKKAYLTKIIWGLGGAVTTEGSLCTHVLTVKARRTLNFCTALCSGAWIVSPNWLKESFRQGRFLDEVPFILNDDEYLNKFRVDLKEAVLRARTNPQALLKGYSICLTTNVQPPVETLSAIVQSAGGEVSVGLGNMGDKSRTIFIACEDDMEEALLAVRIGIRTFSSDWLMNCIMKQELDLDAPQFAECL